MRGTFILKENGRVIQSGHNMIVQSGRNFIRDLFIDALEITPKNTGGAAAQSNDEPSPTSKYTPIIKLGTSNVGSSLTMTDLASEITSAKADTDIKYIDIPSTGLSRVVFTIEITGSAENANVIQEIGLFIKDNNSNPTTDTMFSRIVVDPVYLRSGTKYSIEYSIYF